MMRSMRASAKWIMAFLAAAFVGWMVFDVGMNIGGRGTGVSLTDAAVRVNGRKIELQTFYAAVRQAQEQQRAQYGSGPVTLEDQRALEDAVLEELIQEILLQEEYQRRGISVSDAEVLQAAQMSPPPEIMQVPDFQTDGQFDFDKYRRFLASSPDPNFLLSLEARYRQEIPRLKLFEQITSDLYHSDSKLWRIFQDQADSIVLRVLQIRPETVFDDSVVSLSDAEVRQYYSSNREEFERPATAYLSYVTLPRETNAADSAAALERASQLKAEIDAGTELADVARRESADSTSRVRGGDLGMQPNDRFVPEFTQAARALRPGQVSDPVLSPFGYHIIRLESRTQDSLHASHVLIPIELAGDHLDVVEARADTLDLYAADQTDPGALDEAADMLGLPVKTAAPVVDGSRVLAEGQIVPDAALWAFEAVRGETSLVIETPDSYFAFRLDSLRPAGVPPFESIEASVRRAAMNARKWEMARDMATQIAQDLRNGQPLMEAALANVLSARTLGPMTRMSPDPTLTGVPEVVGAGFGLGVGEPSPPIETEQGIFFVEPASKQLADSSAFLERIDQLRVQAYQAAQQDRVRQFLISLRSAADVVDRRREIERAQRELDQQQSESAPFNPLGF